MRRSNQLIPIRLRHRSVTISWTVVGLLKVSHDAVGTRRMIGRIVSVAFPASPTRPQLHQTMATSGTVDIEFEEGSSGGIRPRFCFVVPVRLWTVILHCRNCQNDPDNAIFVPIWSSTSLGAATSFPMFPVPAGEKGR